MNMNPVEKRLRNYSLLRTEIRFLELEVQASHEMLETLNNFQIDLDDEVRAKVDERIENVKQQIEALQKEKVLIETVIEELEDETVRKMFKLKYFSSLLWKEISGMVGYCERQCRRIHKETIENIISKKLM